MELDGVVLATPPATHFAIAKERLEREGIKAKILAVETINKMSDHQIAAKVRERFQSKSQRR